MEIEKDIKDNFLYMYFSKDFRFQYVITKTKGKYKREFDKDNDKHGKWEELK